MRAEDLPSRRRALAIGVGNHDRGDDGVGLRVIALLKEQGGDFETLTAEGDLSDLVLRWGANQEVVVVDAMRTGLPPGTVRTIDVMESSLRTDPLLLSSHGIGLAETVELARLLQRLPRSLRVVGVEGRSFSHFAEMTEEVRDAVPDVVAAVRALLAIR